MRSADAIFAASLGLIATAAARACSMSPALRRRAVDRAAIVVCRYGRSTRKMSRIRFGRVASTISSSLASRRPSASRPTSQALVPSVTFSISPGGRPAQRGVFVDGAVEVAAVLQVDPGEDEIPEAAIGEVERLAGLGQKVRKPLQRTGDARAHAADRADRERSAPRRPRRSDRRRWPRTPAARPLPTSPPADADRAARRARGCTTAARSTSRAAFLRKSDGPRLSRRNRRTSPVDAPSS